MSFLYYIVNIVNINKIFENEKKTQCSQNSFKHYSYVHKISYLKIIIKTTMKSIFTPFAKRYRSLKKMYFCSVNERPSSFYLVLEKYFPSFGIAVSVGSVSIAILNHLISIQILPIKLVQINQEKELESLKRLQERALDENHRVLAEVLRSNERIAKLESKQL